ncbi:MAG: DoxX family membrane protein [Proteobacteria bacterium]|nr:DoxX family membrane protein [Pseudomonadota bacterium]
MASRGGSNSLSLAAAIGMAAGLCGLGALSLMYQDTALQWEPVPAAWPRHAILGALSGLILLAGGVMMAMNRTRALGAGIAGAFIGLWVIGLHLPHVVARPTDLTLWLAVAECTAMAIGGFLLRREMLAGPGVLTDIELRLFGLCCVMFGISHFAYARFTASMIPAWLPDRVALAYLTGAIHTGAGLGLIAGIRRRWAATIEALMMTSFVLLVHLPRVAAKPGDRTELTLLFVAVTLTSAAWIVASSRTALKGR